MAENRKDQKFLSTPLDLSKAPTRSRRTAASADNPPPTLNQELAFRDDKKGDFDKILIINITLSKLNGRTKGTPETCRKSNPHPSSSQPGECLSRSRKGRLGQYPYRHPFRSKKGIKSSTPKTRRKSKPRPSSSQAGGCLSRS